MSGELKRVLEDSFENFDAWKTDFVAVGGMRGVGWAILYQDPLTGQLSNHWIELHQQGVPSGFKPILVMDVWEHAFLLDYKPSERSKYIEAFFSNIEWDVVNKCFSNSAAVRPAA
jgi:Fe-Mn family superoxide dismutase